MTTATEIREALLKHEVIPTVIHDETFIPKGFLSAKLGSGDEVHLGNEIKRGNALQLGQVDFTPFADFRVSKDDRFTLVVTDPDAPSKNYCFLSEVCHCFITDIRLKESLDGSSPVTTENLEGKIVFPFIRPGPPPFTGFHRYVFVLYKQRPGIKLEAPAARPTWGTGYPGSGAQEYADKYGLEPLAVNFFLCQR
ncbi:DEKNAAC100624 [Brettanomyces naardenensis]|uniref:DEKNAAC100624 n=1 Tax=Brettanomyces naardenensis TaxID=13370 RepID=A0A448YEG3_BRENA|nr:DEKNAAC100624 [Brettanomyces naardenensis]